MSETTHIIECDISLMNKAGVFKREVKDSNGACIVARCLTYRFCYPIFSLTHRKEGMRRQKKTSRRKRQSMVTTRLRASMPFTI